ncbi:hypothetical protein C8F04DRAFT_1174631 [Mycena alexandri]|uniref:Uncharacterized protein n=1 Tax=Mycena alexandri TaxID=1745969 RepID=A0AAD6TIJ8_9AGAR|nr:hypothetical protein C8F04DRAFT_1174631 [Mycena alexandri]
MESPFDSECDYKQQPHHGRTAVQRLELELGNTRASIIPLVQLREHFRWAANIKAEIEQSNLPLVQHIRGPDKGTGELARRDGSASGGKQKPLSVSHVRAAQGHMEIYLNSSLGFLGEVRELFLRAVQIGDTSNGVGLTKKGFGKTATDASKSLFSPRLRHGGTSVGMLTGMRGANGPADESLEPRGDHSHALRAKVRVQENVQSLPESEFALFFVFVDEISTSYFVGQSSGGIISVPALLPGVSVAPLLKISGNQPLSGSLGTTRLPPAFRVNRHGGSIWSENAISQSVLPASAEVPKSAAFPALPSLLSLAWSSILLWVQLSQHRSIAPTDVTFEASIARGGARGQIGLERPLTRQESTYKDARGAVGMRKPTGMIGGGGVNQKTRLEVTIAAVLVGVREGGIIVNDAPPRGRRAQIAGGPSVVESSTEVVRQMFIVWSVNGIGGADDSGEGMRRITVTVVSAKRPRQHPFVYLPIREVLRLYFAVEDPHMPVHRPT